MERNNTFSAFWRRFRSENLAREQLPPNGDDLSFTMECNGYSLQKNGEWNYLADDLKPFSDQFKAQEVSFFGPNAVSDFFSGRKVVSGRFRHAFEQRPVMDLIRKYRSIDEEQAARIAFLLGGLIRHRDSRAMNSFFSSAEIENDIRFVSRMAMLGVEESAEAVASAMSMYIISGGSTKEDIRFNGDVHQMSEAVRDDPIVPEQTEELGLSQVLRIKDFVAKKNGEEAILPDTEQDEDILSGFPTVGAEFHLPADTPKKSPYFWQRLAILNMSQFHRDSFVQLSRNDRDVIEVRMNPSTFPVTVANWNNIRHLLPELNQSFFTITLNRKDGGNFSWYKGRDKELLDKLQTLGMLSYAGLFDNVPERGRREEINFGSIYLGQTVKMKDGVYDFSGMWGGGQGRDGQMGIYAGFGHNLPYLAYYLSMALVEPQILDYVPKELFKAHILEDALSVSPTDRRRAFIGMQNRIETLEKLNRASEAGRRIVEKLNP